MKRLHIFGIACVLFISTLLNSHACNFLTIKNERSDNITCNIKGKSIIGQSHALNITVTPYDQHRLSPKDLNFNHFSLISCDGLTHRLLNHSSFPHVIHLQPKQTRVLSILLYPYIPTPKNNFSSLIERIVSEFQKISPEVSLDIQFSPDVYEPLHFSHLAKNFDIIEFDTMLLEDWKSYLIPLETSPSPRDFFQISIDSVKSDSKFFGVPSWICTEYIFSLRPSISAIKTWKDLLIDVQKYPSKEKIIPLATHLMNPLDLTAMYQKIAADIYGANFLQKMTYEKMDPLLISRLLDILELCNISGEQKCLKTSAHDAAEAFALHNASRFMGFAESSFEVRSISSSTLYSGIFFPGHQQQAVFYSDAFGRSHRCYSSLCSEDYTAFTNYMNQIKTRKWIVFSGDCPKNTPPRRTLPGLRAFYTPENFYIDGIYKAASEALGRATHFPSMTLNNRIQLNQLILSALNINRSLLEWTKAVSSEETS